ncbi:hypothetical protein GQ457_07G007090 [Hibiscus cannabinus]
MVKDSICWNIRDVNSTYFWYDNWLDGEGRLIFSCTASVNPSPVSVGDVINDSGRWNWHRISPCVGLQGTMLVKHGDAIAADFVVTQSCRAKARRLQRSDAPRVSPIRNLLMGAPKQKWTAEEEAALKAGILKHGTGKWRNILSDPEFSSVLCSRSNVDLKDKWRNINATAIWGSRQKAKLALKRNQLATKHDDNPMALITVPPREEVIDAKPLAVSSGTSRATGSKKTIPRLDNILLEAITSLKEPAGSDRASIAVYIEEKYAAPPNLKKLLATKLKLLVANGTLIKVKHKYTIAPRSTIYEARKSPLLLLEGRQKDSAKAKKKGISILTKTQVDADLLKMRSMTAEEAAAAAAQAVAEAEVAIAEAEKAAREAELAEAEAEAAKIFAKAAEKALKSRMLDTCCELVQMA